VEASGETRASLCSMECTHLIRPSLACAELAIRSGRDRGVSKQSDLLHIIKQFSSWQRSPKFQLASQSFQLEVVHGGVCLFFRLWLCPCSKGLPEKTAPSWFPGLLGSRETLLTHLPVACHKWELSAQLGKDAELADAAGRIH